MHKYGFEGIWEIWGKAASGRYLGILSPLVFSEDSGLGILSPLVFFEDSGLGILSPLVFFEDSGLGILSSLAFFKVSICRTDRLSCACKRAGRRRQDGYEFFTLGPANLSFWLKELICQAQGAEDICQACGNFKRQGLLGPG
jgi:hypothetical protein